MSAKEFEAILKKKSAPVQFERTMGLFGATILGMGAIMGAGIYVLVGLAAKQAGSGVWITYLVCGLLAYLSVLLYAELASLETASGGGYIYAYRHLGPLWGFLTGWHLAVGSIFACVIYAMGFGIYLLNFFPEAWQQVYLFKIMAVVLTLGLTTLSTRSSGGENTLQISLTLGNILVLLILIAFALPQGEAEHFQPIFGANGPGGVFGAIGIIYLSFFGYQLIANNSEEIIQPEKTVSRAMKLALLLSLVMYMLTVVGSLMVIPASQLASSAAPLALVARSSIGHLGGYLVILGGILASGAALNSTLVSQSRQFYAMGRDRMLPRSIGQLSGNQPLFALWTGGVLVSVLIVLGNLETIARIANFCFLVSMLPISFALHRLQREQINAGNSLSLYKRAIPWASLVANVMLLIMMGVETFMAGNQIVMLGLAVFFFYSRQREVRGATGMSVVLSEEEKSGSYFGGVARILVPMANPKTQRPLLSLSEALLMQNPRKDKELLAMSMVLAQQQTDFLQALESSSSNALNLLSSGADLLKETAVNFRPVVRVSKSLPLGVVHGARDEKCSLIVMGVSDNVDSSGKPTMMEEVLGRTPADIVFLKARSSQFAPRRIAVALGGRSDNLNLMLSVAGSLADYFNGQISFLSILPPDYTARQRETTDNILIKAIDRNESRALYEARMLISDQPLQTLIDESHFYDLLIAGTPRMGLQRKPTFGPFSIQLCMRSACSVILVHDPTGLTNT